MQDTEITDIEASVQTLVRRAYELGRSHALRKVVDVLNADRPGSDQLALMAPAPQAADPTPDPQSVPEEMNGVAPVNAKKPWWAWPVR